MARGKRLYSILLLGTVLVLGSACSSEWEKVSKKGNTWDYKLSHSAGSQTVVSTVGEVYKIGDRTYAEIVLDTNAKPLAAVLYSWDDDKKALLLAGKTSLVPEKEAGARVQFYVEEQVLGSMKNVKSSTATNSDGTVITYRETKDITVPAGKFECYVFERSNPAKGIRENYSYTEGKGFALINDSAKGRSFELLKFTEGKGGDPVALGSKDGAEKGLALIRKFYVDAQAGDLNAMLPLFTKTGKDDVAQGAAEFRLLLQRIKDHRRPWLATVYFRSADHFGLRFQYYEEIGGKPSVKRADVAFELATEEKQYRIAKYLISYSTVVE
jgi:hypothetical protein